MALDDKTRELIAVGASIAANNPPSLKYHVRRARDFGAGDPEIAEAVETGKAVRRGAASKTDLFAASLGTPIPRGGCRRGGERPRPGTDERNCGCDGAGGGSDETAGRRP